MAIQFDPTQPFQTVEDETLESLTAPRVRRQPVAPVVTAPVGPVFDPSKLFTPVAEVAGPVFDPNQPVIKVYGMEEVAAKTPEELAADKDFMPVQFGLQNKAALLANPELQSKVEKVYAARETSGTSLSEKAQNFITGAVPAAKMLLSGITRAAKVSAKFSPGGIASRVGAAITVPEGGSAQLAQDYLKTGAEAALSVESAALGTTDLLRRSAREVGEGLGRIPGVNVLPSVGGIPVQKAKEDMTEGDWRNRYFNDVEAAEKVEAAAKGSAEVAKLVGIDAERLKRDFDIEVDPVIIEELSVITDPVNYVPLGATVGVVGKIGGRMTRAAVATTKTAKQAQQLAKIWNDATSVASGFTSSAKNLAGGVAKAAGGAVESVGNVVEKGVRALGGTASGVGIGGLLGGDIYAALGGAAVAKVIPRAIQVAGRTAQSAGRILTGEAAAPAALALVGDTLKAGTAGALKGAAEGGVLILPFSIGARPEEEEQLLGMVAIGSGLRAGVEGARPGARAAGRAAQNKLSEIIFQHVEQAPLAESPTYGTDSTLDSTHTANVSKLNPKAQKLVNWGRELLRAAGGEVYVLDNASFTRETGNKTALGYAVNIGEKVAPDGTSTPVFRILLNQSSEALPHEFFHALTDLDPKRASDFRDTVKKTLTPEQLKSFEQLYNSRLNGGLPEVQWKQRLTPEQVANEVAAETFSRLFLAEDLSGVSPTVQRKAALFVSSLLEKLGAPLGGVGKAPGAGVSTLGVRPGAESVKAGQAWIENMLKRVNDTGTLGQPPIISARPAGPATPIPADVVRRKPTGKTVVTPAPVPVPTPRPTPVNPPLPTPPAVPVPGVRNIRTPRAAQDDFAGQRAEVTNTDPARVAAEATGDANTIARVDEISQLIESGSPVIEIEHSGVRAAGTETAPSARSTRRAEQEAAYIAEGMAATPQPIREAYQKVFVPVRWEVVAGKPQLLAMSLDKVIANTHKLVKESAAKGVESKIPYEVADGKLTDNAWGQVVDDLKAYSENQANGYRGTGEKLTRPTEDIGLSIPAENPAYNPRPLTQERADFLNAVQGLNPPLTARTGKQSSTITPGNVKGQILAEVNLRAPETPSMIRPEDITKQTFPSGRQIAETNPLRNELAAAGVPVRELIEVTERINAKDINSVRPRPDLDFKAPVTDTIRGGFLPGDEHSLVPVLTTDDGGIYPGKSHADAMARALAKRKAGEITPEQFMQVAEAMMVDGKHQFLDTTNGKVLNRSEAGKLVGASGTVQSEQLNQASTQKNLDAYLAKPVEAGAFLPGVETDKALRNGQLKDPRPSVPEGDEAVRGVASNYARSAGIENPPHRGYDELKPELSKRIADFYESAKDSPNDPAVKASYQSLTDETLAQYKALTDAGYTVEPFTGAGEPYKSSAEMVADVRDNKHLFFLLTEGNITAGKSNPLLQPAGIEINGKPLVVNDVFRAVHDLFGHAKEGYQFGPRGELNAWKAHAPMFSDAAQGALAAETLAQNSWVNFGPHLRDDKGGIRNVPLTERPFAEQKNVVVPAELIAEARGQFLPRGEEPMPGSIEEWDARQPRVERKISKIKKTKTTKSSTENPTAWILPDGKVRPLSTEYHEHDLAQNSGDYNKRFGTKFTPGWWDNSRLGALNAGFVRMRYEPNGGTMNVEVGVNHWSKQKAKVLDTLLSHSGKIDKLRINLADRKGQLVDNSDDLTLFKSENKDADIISAVNLIVPPKVTRAEGIGPSNIQRARAMGGDFLPGKSFPDSVDPIEMAAIWDREEQKMFTGGYHAAIQEENRLPNNGNFIDGFVTRSGKFLNRDEALEHAKSIKQLRPRSDSELLGYLEVDTFNRDITRQRIDDYRAGRLLPGEVEPLLDLGLPSEERMKQLRVKGRVRKAKEGFPEARPLEYAREEDGSFTLGEDNKPKPRAVEYGFMDTPLAREAAKGLKGAEREEAFTDALANRLTKAARAAKSRKEIQAGAKWYSTTRARLKGLLGDDSKFFSELLGATSARTPVDQNFTLAVDAYNQFKSGNFDEIIRKYREGKSNWDAGAIQDFLEESGNENPTRGQYLTWWVEKNELEPRQSNGNLYKMNSRAVLKVLDGSWREEVQGPKTPNFAGNLSGETFEATVDVWAARLLHRLSNEGNPKRWRILPENETGVTDADFNLGQAAFRKAADKLGMKPDALQAILWFSEKDFWEKKGWTRGTGAKKSDFQSLLSETERLESGQLRRKTPQIELGFEDIKKRK